MKARMLNWLLLFVPVADRASSISRPSSHLLIFLAAGLAILPLAGWMGRATEHLAERMGEGIGGLLNATFGNAAELIIALAALRAGLLRRRQGLDRRLDHRQHPAGAGRRDAGRRVAPSRADASMPSGARAQATMLTLAAIAFILPAAYQADGGGPTTRTGLVSLSVAIVDRAAGGLRALPRLLAGHACLAVRRLARRRAARASASGLADRARPRWCSPRHGRRSPG